MTKDVYFTNEKLEEYIDKPVYGTSKKCSYEKDEFSIPVYRIPNINTRKSFIEDNDIKYSSFTDKEIEKLKLQEDDILLIRSNGSLPLVGRSAIVNKQNVNNIFAGYLIRLRAKNNDLLMKYLLYYLGSFNARRFIEKTAKSSNGINNINALEILGIPYLHCPKNEQLQIVEEIEARLSVCGNIEETVDYTLKKAESLRQSILKKAFEGKLVEQEVGNE